MCLAKFAVTYEPKYESSGAENGELNINENPNDDENEDDLNENDRNQFIKLKNNLGIHAQKKKRINTSCHFIQTTQRTRKVLACLLYTLFTMVQ